MKSRNNGKAFLFGLLTVAALACAACDYDTPENCHDGFCFDDYNPCGDGVCQTGEAEECPEDCVPTFCGNGFCDELWNETVENCPRDCENFCGDGICRNWETENNCYFDCGRPPLCGDHTCEYGRGEDDPDDELYCFEDCGCWNGRCDSELGENEANCYQDCGECGNGICGGPEDQYFCPEDCPRPIECGDLICEFEETHENCPDDCHCGWDTCDLDETHESCPEDCAETCGDGTCDESIGEDWLRCPIDCKNCNDREFPIDCGDDLGCWPEGTNCQSDVFVCGDAVYRCGVATDRANCCDDVFQSCPSGSPYYCSATDECMENLDDFETNCESADACTDLNMPCSSPAE